jgi:hypothetical protein
MGNWKLSSSLTLAREMHYHLSHFASPVLVSFFKVTVSSVCRRVSNIQFSRFSNFLNLGLEWDNISECVDWMVPFVSVVKSTTPVKLKTFKKIPMEDRHNIQTHTNYLALLVCFFVLPCYLWSPERDREDTMEYYISGSYIR